MAAPGQLTAKALETSAGLSAVASIMNDLTRSAGA